MSKPHFTGVERVLVTIDGEQKPGIVNGLVNGNALVVLDEGGSLEIPPRDLVYAQEDFTPPEQTPPPPPPADAGNADPSTEDEAAAALAQSKKK